MRGEDLDGPSVRPPLLAQIANGVGRLAREAEPDGHVAAPGSPRVAFEAEGPWNRKIAREARVETDAGREPSGLEERPAGAAGPLPGYGGPGIAGAARHRCSSLADARVHSGFHGSIGGAGGRADVEDARRAAEKTGDRAPKPALVLTGPKRQG